jgi:hypothetical protein
MHAQRQAPACAPLRTRPFCGSVRARSHARAAPQPAQACWRLQRTCPAARGASRVRAAPELNWAPSTAEEPLERLLAEVLYALLAARAAGVPPPAVLPKFHDTLTPKAYTSVLIALGRKEAWDTAASVAAWVRGRGMELPAEAYVRIAARRAQEGHWDRAVEALGWMKDLGCAPSGEAVEAVAALAAEGAPHFRERERLREVVSWVRATDAGRALWRVYAPDAAPAGGGDASAPAWRSQGLVVEDGGGVLGAPLGQLREALREVGGFPQQRSDASSAPPDAPPDAPAAAPASAAPPPVLSDIDALLRSKRRP